MSDKKIVISDEMIEAELIEKSKMLDISVDKLIDQYQKGIISGHLLWQHSPYKT